MVSWKDVNFCLKIGRGKPENIGPNSKDISIDPRFKICA